MQNKLDLESLINSEKNIKNIIHSINTYSSNILSDLFQDIDNQLFMFTLFGQNPKKIRPNFSNKNENKTQYRKFINTAKDKFVNILKTEFWSSMFLINMNELIHYDEKKMSSYFKIEENSYKQKELCGNKVYQSGQHNEIDVKIFQTLNKQEYEKRGYSKFCQPENKHLVENQITNKSLSDKFGGISYAETSLYKFGLTIFSNEPFYREKTIDCGELDESGDSIETGNFLFNHKLGIKNANKIPQNGPICTTFKLREVINLQKMEDKQTGSKTMSDWRLSQKDLKNLGEFVIYKMQTSNDFNLNLSHKDDENSDEAFS